MIFNATIVNHSTPAVSVKVADSSGVTYSQVKQSLGNQVYNVNSLYLYSDNTSQLISTLQYQIYDSTGNQDVRYIATTVNPYQKINSLFVDLNNSVNVPIILNGNSSVSTTVYPQTYLQLKFLSSRITNAFGNNLSNFRDMQKITNTDFFDNYNDTISSSKVTKKEIVKSIQSNFSGDIQNVISDNNNSKINNAIIILASAVVISVSTYFIFNNTKTFSDAIRRN